MKIELSKEKIRRMKAIMGQEGFKEWVEAMKSKGNEVVFMREDREDTKKPGVSQDE